MAKVIMDDSQTREVSQHYVWWHLALIGAGLGLIYWILTYLVSHFIIDQLFCGNSANAITCSNSIGISGNIADILVAAIGLVVMVRMRIFRPIIIAAASAILLWGLASWTEGLWFLEATFWSILLFTLCYLMFSWIGRYARSTPVLIATLIILIIGRILLAL